MIVMLSQFSSYILYKLQCKVKTQIARKVHITRNADVAGRSETLPGFIVKHLPNYSHKFVARPPIHFALNNEQMPTIIMNIYITY